jgi:hypothetical protein
MRTATVKLAKIFPRIVGKDAGRVRSVFFSLLLTVAALSSCVVGEREYEMSVNAAVEDKDVVFRIAVPYTAKNNGSQTRAIGGGEENTIRSVYVLAFKVESDNSETFDYSAIAYKATGNVEGNPTQDFMVTVKVKSHSQRFVVIANADAETAALLGKTTWTGTPKETMLEELEVELQNAGDTWKVISSSNYTAFPMWGESGKETVTGTTTGLQGSIPLLRMVAKINVQLDETVTGLTDKFQLKSVRLYNTNTKGSVVPASFTDGIKDGERYLWVTTPTIPADIMPYNKRHEGPLVYTDFTTPGQTDIAMRGAIYTFETAAPADGDMLKATCLVVGGKFDADGDGDFSDESETFYRVDFLESDGETFRDILRNHQYIVNVVDVTGTGHGTPGDAFQSKSVNMKVLIQAWNEVGMTGIVFDGQYMLGVSRDEFSFSRDGRSGNAGDNVLHVFTDYAPLTGTTPPAGWYVEKTVDASDGTTLVSWLTLTPDNGGKGDNTEVVLTFGENTTNAERSAIVWLAAGRLRYPVRVTQSFAGELSLRLQNSANEDISEMTFISKAGAASVPASRTLDVKWKPLDADLMIVNTPIGANPFSAPGMPALGTTEVTGGNGGTGTKSYTIAPPALTTAELSSNPFMEKASLLTFTVGDGISYENKSVMLRQINYNLLTNAASGYELNAGAQNKTINVRSNFGWTITGVTDPGDILRDESTLEGTTGNANTGTGNPLTFTLRPRSSNNSKDGKSAVITLTSLIDGSTWNITIMAIEALYIGMFGGELKKTNGKWRFEKKLYMQSNNEGGVDATYQWKTEVTSTPGTTSYWDGKGNTWAMRSGTTHPAARACFTKNSGYASITEKDDPNYVWYLPAQKQLLAVLVVHNSFNAAYKLSDEYWNSTEIVASNASSGVVYFDPFNVVGYASNTNSFRVRCVIEVTP